MGGMLPPQRSRNKTPRPPPEPVREARKYPWSNPVYAKNKKKCNKLLGCLDESSCKESDALPAYKTCKIFAKERALEFNDNYFKEIQMKILHYSGKLVKDNEFLVGDITTYANTVQETHGELAKAEPFLTLLKREDTSKENSSKINGQLISDIFTKAGGEGEARAAALRPLLEDVPLSTSIQTLTTNEKILFLDHSVVLGMGEQQLFGVCVPFMGEIGVVPAPDQKESWAGSHEYTINVTTTFINIKYVKYWVDMDAIDNIKFMTTIELKKSLKDFNNNEAIIKIEFVGPPLEYHKYRPALLNIKTQLTTDPPSPDWKSAHVSLY
jgi:hypothetical protein